MRKTQLVFISIIFIIFISICIFQNLKNQEVTIQDDFILNQQENHRDNTLEPQENKITDFQKELMLYAPEFRLWAIREDDTVNRWWQYEIGYAENILASNTSEWHTPKISKRNSQIIRLELGGGSNSNRVLYFDLWDGSISSEFNMMSYFADYVDSDYPFNDTRKAMVAFPYYLHESHKTIVVIRNIFDNNFYLEIDEGFMTVLGGINNMLFLNENNLFIDYNIETSESDFINKNVVFIFNSEGYSTVEL